MAIFEICKLGKKFAWFTSVFLKNKKTVYRVFLKFLKKAVFFFFFFFFLKKKFLLFQVSFLEISSLYRRRNLLIHVDRCMCKNVEKRLFFYFFQNCVFYTVLDN